MTRQPNDRPAARLSLWLAGAVSASMLAGATARGDGGGAWFDKDWPLRRVVHVNAPRTPGAGGAEIAVVEIPTDLAAAADGHDLRVANSIGRALPMRLLSVGPGSVARVAFEVAPGPADYSVYYGNAKAPAPDKALELKIARGLLLETRTYAGGDINTLDGIQRSFERASIVQGADFVPNIFLGHNLFGPSPRTISRYTGLIRTPAAGDYGFATTSDDASFLAIDGQLVVGWGGYHGWVGDARHNKTVTLTAGLHELEYLHVNVGGNGGAVAAWLPPGEKKWAPIPRTAFLPVAPGTLGSRERFGTSVAAAMTFTNIGETLIGNDDYVQRYRFTCWPTGLDDRRATIAWDFGDGLTAAGVGGVQVDHVYLIDGPVQVTVTVSHNNQQDTVSNRVVVSRNWREVTQRRIDGVAGYARAVAKYDFAKMKPAAVARAMDLFERANEPAGMVAAGHALAAFCEPVDDRVLAERMEAYAKFLIARDATNGPTAAVNEYVTAAGRAGSPFVRARMYDEAGRVLLDRLGDDVKAEQMFRAALTFADRGPDDAIRTAWIGLGDVYRHRGDGEKAAAAYASAEKMGPQPSANQRAVQVGSLSRSIEFYIRDGDFETAGELLAEWDNTFPTHRLVGYSTLLWVRFYQAQKMHREATREAGDLVAANPRSNYAAELLIASADSWLTLNDQGRARQLLEHVVAVYPDSPLVAQAKDKLAKLGSD